MWKISDLIVFKTKWKLNVFSDLFIKVNADTNALFVCGELVLMTQLLLKAFLDQCEICSFHSRNQEEGRGDKTHVVKEQNASGSVERSRFLQNYLVFSVAIALLYPVTSWVRTLAFFAADFRHTVLLKKIVY